MARLTTRGWPLLQLLVVPLAAAYPWLTTGDDATPTIRIVEPADGAVVNGPVAVRVEVLNFTLQPPRSGKKPNAGHIHYWIDDSADAVGTGPTTKTNVRLFVPPGRRKIRAELVLDDHTSLADGHGGNNVFGLPGDDPAFERRSSMSTISITVQ